MNKEKVISQFQRLLAQLQQQAELAGNPVCREKRFDPLLFADRGHRLLDYIQQIRRHLLTLQAMSDSESPPFQWLSQRMVDQCQAMQRELSSLDSRQPAPATSASYWLNKYQQQRGYEARLCEMIEQQEQQLNTADTLQQQQLIAEHISVLEQRLARCRHALRESHWQASLRN